jgi:hypothetical protein
LADRVQETLPGAPQDRRRTNLFKGEQQTSTPETSYAGELAAQAGLVFHGIGNSATSAAEALATVGKLLIAGGTLVAGWKLATYLRERSRRKDQRSAVDECRALNANLARAASRRDAGGAKPYAIQLSRAELEALHFLSGRYDSAQRLVDGLVPLDDSADAALGREYNRSEGPYRFHIRRTDVRRVLRATAHDGGNYGAIPNLRSDAVDWLLAEERSHLE